jgi:CHAT domain-containing protein/predicted negative regulator of RcsB-dependent stress response
MDVDALLEQLLESRSAEKVILASLTDMTTAQLVDRLKQEADRHWAINANRSLELAELIIRVGRARGDQSHIALGTMARGDALRFLGRIREAWEVIEEAGRLFQGAGDEIGWARTRIGRLHLSVGLNRVAEALADAQRAYEIFTRYDEPEKLLRLEINTAIVHTLLGDAYQALTVYRSALTTAERLGTTGEQYLGQIHTNIGLVYEALGDFRQALAAHERARAIAKARQEARRHAIAETNVAIIFVKQGHYREALQMLHRARDLYAGEQLPRDAAEVNRIIVECYLLLNRYDEARLLAEEVVAAFREFGEAYEEALTLLELAVAEAELANFGPAQAAIDAAEPIFASLGAANWVATARLRRGQIALKQGDLPTARREAAAAAACFESNGQQVRFATSVLLQGQVALAAADRQSAQEAATRALRIAWRCNIPPLRYTASLLLGRIKEMEGDLTHARRRYHAAAATVERVQRSLTITHRPGFLEDKRDALRALIALHLRTGHTVQALEALERAKSLVLLDHLANRQHLRWMSDDPHCRALIEELNRLRDEHQWLFRIAHEQSTDLHPTPSTLSRAEALAEVAVRERRMRTITERLYLWEGDSSPMTRAAVPAICDLQASLSEDTLLIEYYNDGVHLWAFTLDEHTLQVHPLPTTVAAIDRLLAQLQINVDAALSLGPQAAPPSLSNLGQRLLQRLYHVLLAPLGSQLRGAHRLMIVPYGALHYLPFHLLYCGSCHLIEQKEVVILPAAGLLTMCAPRRPRGARVLANSWDGRLPQTISEAQLIVDLFGGQLCYDQAACRPVLQRPPTQILHIAAHGQHRLDQPDLSYIQLADGQLYTDDLVQHDLSYELVTLSACETGRAHVAGGDELIGLGRGFLYAGAGALVTGLWRVADDVTTHFMEHMYRALLGGASKAAALRDAQCALHAAEPHLHPAYWGAFQLVGNAQPLSSNVD